MKELRKKVCGFCIFFIGSLINQFFINFLIFKNVFTIFTAYVRLYTNFGPLNLELHSDMVPKTCENFLKHCESGYYNGTKFHRSIRNFMVECFVESQQHLNICLINIHHFHVNFPIWLFRFKEVIQQVQGQGGSQYGESHLKMNSSQTWLTLGVAFCLWQMLVPTQTSHNC